MASSDSRFEQGLALERLDADLFRNVRPLYQGKDARGIFGGAVVAQSLMAAMATVDARFAVHSLHSYFVRAGDNSVPVLYSVEDVRTGRSYCTRTVQARQHGRCILTVTVSFAAAEPAGISHAVRPPALGSPADALDLAADQAALASVGVLLTRSEASPSDSRPGEARYRALPSADPAEHRDLVWMRVYGPIRDQRMNAVAVAYLSDQLFLGGSMRANGVPADKVGMMVSLDHSVYFHNPIHADQWMCHVVASPWTGHGRGFVQGHFYDADGKLLATTTQEGVLRMQKAKI
ncbi:thioesterase-like superfamily-domain-containing protein [Dipodascopsis tothii]|uniref:thioesterase-like superfamily-domain-containing protein n=1 Tax=Dipodascopsis tothii TaxID=44089 RepID=UPI0034CD1922